MKGKHHYRVVNKEGMLCVRYIKCCGGRGASNARAKRGSRNGWIEQRCSSGQSGVYLDSPEACLDDLGLPLPADVVGEGVLPQSRGALAEHWSSEGRRQTRERGGQRAEEPRNEREDWNEREELTDLHVDDAGAVVADEAWSACLHAL